MQITSLRFIEPPASSDGPYKRYQITADDRDILTCDLTKKTVWEPIDILNKDDQSAHQLAPERKLLNKKWHLSSASGDTRGEIESVASDGWAARDAQGAEVLRVLDPRKWSEKLVETALNSWPDRYVVMVDGQEAGQIARCLRPGEEEPKTRFQKLKGLLKPRDWTAEFYPPIAPENVHLAVASVLLLVEVTVPSARS